MSRKLFVISVLTIIAISGLLLFFSESYPAVLVNWHPISLDSFNRESAAALFYYNKMSEVYNKESLLTVNTPEFLKEIRRAVLEKLVENRIVAEELNKRLKNGELDEIIGKKIKEITDKAGDGIEEKIKTLYGISMADFRREILEPQARLEVLQGRFIIENNTSSTFDEWLGSIKSRARVVVLVPGFRWDGEKILIDK